MTKTKSIIILVFSLLWSLGAQSQIYYKRIRYVNNHFSQELPRGYSIFITGPVEATVDEVTLTILEENQTRPDVYVWQRINPSQTEFEILISRPLERKTTFTHELTKVMAAVGGAAALTSSTDPQPGTPEVNPTSRWGLVSGIGSSFLGKKESIDHDMFGYVAAKFIFSKRVNKTNKFLDDPTPTVFSTRVYENAWDRFSLLVGGSTTRMGFKGKELLNPVYNVKPMIGLSFDFSPEISIDGGFLFYDYQKGNTSLYTDLDSKLGTGMFVSISIDMDVFTRLKFAFAGKPYNKTDQN